MIEVQQGVVQGLEIDSKGVAAFLGVPYSAAPTGPMRFEPPQPAQCWKGVRKAVRFGPRCIQRPPFSDLVFRSDEASENCLTINIWTPEPGGRDAFLPILFYIHGGSFLVGDGSEPRHDGAELAAQGIVVVTVTFRLGVFGFFSHPELQYANAGLYDITAALDWVRTNARAFGGDPHKITIGGSSSGGFAVCTIASAPLTKHKIAGAIIHSGSLLGARLMGLAADLPTLTAERDRGLRFAASAGVSNLSGLRDLLAEDLQNQSSATLWNRPVLDRVFLSANLHGMYRTHGVPCVPVLAGMVSAERSFDLSRSGGRLTVGTFKARLVREYGDFSDFVYAAYGYPEHTRELRIASRDLDSDEWIGVDTFSLCQAIIDGGGQAYSYLFDQSRPAPPALSGGWTSTQGAGHSTDIEYFLGTQELMPIYPWTHDDRRLSKQMQTHILNFVKTGNPNGMNCPEWPHFRTGKRIVLSPTGGTTGSERLAKLADLRLSADGEKISEWNSRTTA